MSARFRRALLPLTAVLVVAGCAAPGPALPAAPPAAVSTTPSPGPVPAAATVPTATATTGDPGTARQALAQLAALPVKGRAPMTGYSRDAFGPAWADVDRNGCDTRDDVLARDLTGVTTKPGTHGCVVTSGTLADPYSGTVIAFTRGQATSAAVQIDHVVPLGDAWQTGAQAWTADRRRAFANDPQELLAVAGRLNEQKGDGDAATWLPPAVGYRCAYAARQVAVKSAYGLWVTPAEHDALAGVLIGCAAAAG
ncbi:MAG: hypothetical protein JWM67_2155 [Mycobacterium sp.]|nr:hypothetical protein [Mycobacterium sp.]